MGVFVVPENGWFWRKEGCVFGPVTEDVLRARILDGVIMRGVPVRLDKGPWTPVEDFESWELVLGSAENLRVRDRHVATRKTFGLAGLVAVLCISAWSVAGQVFPPEGTPLSLVAQAVQPEQVEDPAPQTDVVEDEGSLKRQRIAQGFETALPLLQGCAERFQINGGEVPGRMMLSYIIQNSGSVTDVLIHPTHVGKSPMGRCMVGVMRRVDYPTFAGKVRPVSFPVVFD
mgnify:CR=1 FL=1